MTDTDVLKDLLSDASVVTARIGTYVGLLDGQAMIDMGESRFPVAWSAAYVPMLNEAVNVLSVDGRWFLLGPTQGRPGSGVVTTVGSGQVTVTTDFGEFTMPTVGTPPTSGQTVCIVWPGPTCVGALSIQPAAPEVPPAPGGGGAVTRTATFRAIDAGSTDRSSVRWWTGQPYASDSTFGAWFHGTQIKDTIASGSTLLKAEIYINRVQDQGASPKFTLHTSPKKTGIPTMSAPVTWDPPNGWNVLPAGWGAALIEGGAYFGIGLNQGGYNRFASLAQDALSGALRFKWK